MRQLELLAPARNKEIGIAAIDCGADAVYIAGPDFGARKAAGNSFEDIRELCDYAHRFGARIFVTFNTVIEDSELEQAHSQMLRSQEAGADAFIIRDSRICGWKDITVPLHASTQCAIRDIERAKYFESLGCARIILERQLSLEEVERICKAVSCEVEFFVHGAICVCYSGDCRLSEHIDGRSADKGECIQACRSLYDVYDDKGRLIVKNKAVLSLKDYRLKERLEDLALAGVSSFKIEGRLKNASYVKNVVREYDLALNALIEKHPEEFCRASWGLVSGGFSPDSAKTFNRGYTELFMDGRSERSLSSMNAPKSMGEKIGSVSRIRRNPRSGKLEISVKPLSKGLELRNGDGFSYSLGGEVKGFRGEVCEGLSIITREAERLREGMPLYRNVSADFEKQVEAASPRREIPVRLEVKVSGSFNIEVRAISQDGREILSDFNCDVEQALNRERAEAMFREQLSKRSGIYIFSVGKLEITTRGGTLPLLSASTLNSIRRLVAEDIDALECRKRPLAKGTSYSFDYSPVPEKREELMRSRYCLRHELGLCPVHQGAKDAPSRLILVNNGRRLALTFDCARCEMILRDADDPTATRK